MDNISNYIKEEVDIETWKEELLNGKQGMQSGNNSKLYTSVDGKLKRQVIHTEHPSTTIKTGDIQKTKTSSPSYTTAQEMVEQRNRTDKKYKYWILKPLTIDNIIKDMT